MLPYTIDDSFSYGYGGGLFNPLDKSETNKLWCAYARAARVPDTFRNESVYTAGVVANQAYALGRMPVVLLSGGMDSEVVVKSFLEAGVQFETRTFRFRHELNSHEIGYVQLFCKRHGLVPQYFDIDIGVWARSDEARTLYLNSQCFPFGMIPHMKLISNIWERGGFPVLGNGDVYLEKTADGWKYTELEHMLAWYRHAVHSRILGAIGFFQHTPELILSMLREPGMERLGLGADKIANAMFENSRATKYNIYRKCWPDLLSRPKFGGNEKTVGLYRGLVTELTNGKSELFLDKIFTSYADFRKSLEPAS